MRCRFLISGVSLIAIPVWSVSQLVNLIIKFHGQIHLFDSQINQYELELLLHFAVITASATLWWTAFASLRSKDWLSISTSVSRPSALLTASLILTPNINQSHVVTVAPSDELPTRSVLSPEIAAGVLVYILRRRREQLQSGFSPDLFTDEEQNILRGIEIQAQCASSRTEFNADVITDADVIQLMQAIERPVQMTTSELSVTEEWSLVIKLFGYPVVENKKGEQAKFRKRRALELVTWLALNRDRSRRSAARTAMWDIEINDSSFSTIVSDMRRGMTEIESNISREDWAPTTYSDELPLNKSVITDDVLMQEALKRFRYDHYDYENIVQSLSDVRDVPFAGTSYMWADLDGTTTRLVILAVTAATEVAMWAFEAGNLPVFQIAITAGLRVFPGHEELLGLQAEAKKKSYKSLNSVAIDSCPLLPTENTSYQK